MENIMRPTRWLLPLVLFAALAGASPTPPAAAPKPAPWLSMRAVGGLQLSPTITIDAAGLAQVQAVSSEGNIDYSTQLTPGEFAWIKFLVSQANFADNPGRKFVGADVAEKTITLVAGGKTQTAKFAVDSTFTPLVDCLYKLLNQARAIADLKRGSTYTVDGGVNPLLAAPKVLQPRACVEPLREHLLKKSLQNDNWALEALAYVTTPEEFAGTIAQYVAGSQGKDRRILFETICGHPYYANIPKSQLQAYWPLLRAERDALKSRPSPAEDALQVIRAIDGVYSYLFPR
jgi:hypothetical protein